MLRKQKGDYVSTECSKCNSSYSVHGCQRCGGRHSPFAPGKTHYCGGTMMEINRLREVDGEWVKVDQ